MSYNGTSCNHHYEGGNARKKRNSLPSLSSLAQAINILKGMEGEGFLAKALREGLVEIQESLRGYFSFSGASGGICLKEMLNCLEVARSQIRSTSPNSLPGELREKTLKRIDQVVRTIRQMMRG